MTMMTNEIEQLKLKRRSLRFDINRSIRYHNKRRAFFEFWDNANNFASVMLGSAALYGVLEANPYLVTGASVAVSMLSGLALVVGFGRKATEYQGYAHAQSALLFELVNTPISSEFLKSMRAKVHQQDALEPIPLKWLETLCYNEQCEAEGKADARVNLNWFKRLFAHYH